MADLLPSGFHLLRPAWLWALLPLVLLLLAAWRQRGGGGAWRRACDPHLLPHLLEGRGRPRRGPLALLAAGWLIAVVALAGPAWHKLPQPLFENDEAWVMVLDLSPSMGATDLAPSRLARARFKLLDLLRQADRGRVGLVVFSGEAFVVSPLTQDADTIAAMVPALEPALMPVAGERADLALLRALELFTGAGVEGGRVILIGDGADARAEQAARRLAEAGHTLSVLAVGTAEGAPVPDPVGGFLKDRHGAIVVPRLDLDPLRRIARAGGGELVVLANDDSDIERLMAEPPEHGEGRQRDDMKADRWRDEGPWLVLALLPLALLGFRRGLLACLVAAVSIGLLPPAPAMAGEGERQEEAPWHWADLWQRRDRQAMALLEQGRAAQAAALFEDPHWRAVAHYRAGNYEQAAALFERIKSADGRYNLGNALVRLGRLEEALLAYEQALAIDEDHADARFNRDLVEKLLEKRQEAPEMGSGGDPDSALPSSSDSGGEGQGGESGEAPRPDEARQEADGERTGEPSEQQREQDRSEAQGDREREAGSGEEAEEQPATRAATGDEERLPVSEREQALEQWLQRVPDDPGGLLRRKFIHQYRQRHAGEGEE